MQNVARTWAPTLSVTGADGLPAIADAGNVLRPETALKLSFRLAPTTEPKAAMAALTKALTGDADRRTGGGHLALPGVFPQFA
ncbi:hypothetical protein Poly30_52230 [Planctomycetes bacterium Poly30]|uniref:Uncharacterized protein n=1 Tax=Saltatorellus ferox TaxID=2528018 RepID=A0A518F001_9BACT|nr:hypothetical protein Poly30_52230 [Planctomycetes bacterium Poly30]